MQAPLQPNTAKLQTTIKHVVVLMLENRSFDNLLGFMPSRRRLTASTSKD
jgi:phospholipase C